VHGAIFGVRAADLAKVFCPAADFAAGEEGCGVFVGLEGRASKVRELRIGCGDAADGSGKCRGPFNWSELAELAPWNGASGIWSTGFSWWETLEVATMGPEGTEGVREDGRVAKAELVKKVAANVADESGGQAEWFSSEAGFVLGGDIGVDGLED
jgi:hypothetical protein